jgi:cobalt-zinc-cadmium resistance protein CzcA
MLERLILFSLRERVLILLLTVTIAVAGVVSFLRLPIDAVPDITNVQVQVLTNAPALGPADVERFITIPVELGMSGIPDLEDVRSISRAGLSAVTLVFRDGTDIYWARQQVSERLGEVRNAIPKGMGEVEMGPVSTGLGEIYQFEVRGAGYTSMQLRTILDWDIAFRLRSVSGAGSAKRTKWRCRAEFRVLKEVQDQSGKVMHEATA